MEGTSEAQVEMFLRSIRLRFESRVPGKIFINPGYFFVGGGISSDYRRKFALDMNGGAGYGEKYYGPSWYKELKIAPIIRFTDKFTLSSPLEIK